MSQRISEATRYTVYYKRSQVTGVQHFECEARDRGDAIAQLVADQKTKALIIERVIPGWPERSKKGSTSP